MENKSFTTSIEVAQAPKEVFNHILEVPKWWTKDFEGSNTKPDDEFIIHHPGAHYSKQKVVEIIPDKKIVWLVTESTLYWLKGDQHEWTGTKMIFEINAQKGKTILHFMHDGLVPEKECYSMCRDGWSKVINNHLFNFLATGKTI
ncbi:MAG TPA: SRPBCC domain-containing protein [Puia sp.]|nr:SRPBCC domain-containing protein [Puia sp.]